MTYSNRTPDFPIHWPADAFSQVEAIEAMLNDEFDNSVTFEVRSGDWRARGELHRSLVNAMAEAGTENASLSVLVGDDMVGRISLDVSFPDVLRDWSDSLDSAVGYTPTDDSWEHEKRQMSYDA